MNHTHTPNQIMGQRYSMPQWRTHPPRLNKAGKKFIQEVCGVFLFRTRRVDGNLLPALSALASQQASPTEQTMALCKQFLDYMASQDEAVLTYKACNMVLVVHSNASNLSNLSRTQKSSNQNLLYRGMSTRSGSNLVLCVPIKFYTNTCKAIYKFIVSIMYTMFLNHNLLY